MINLSDYDNKRIKIYLNDGSTFEGFGSFHSVEYCYAEYGIDADCLQIGDYLIRDEEIEKIEVIQVSPSIRNVEEEMALYEKLGFLEVDRLYEYLSTDLRLVHSRKL